MPPFPSDSLVIVRPFSSQRDGDTATIGDPERQIFLSIPTEGLDILTWLANGMTVGETVRLYEQRFAETPDIDEFLGVLAEEGFVGTETADHVVSNDAGQPAGWRLAWISPEWARRLVRAPALAAAALLVGLALALITTDVHLVPGPTVLVFPHHLAVYSLALFAFTLAGVAVHEAAHLVAARAAGVDARIGVSHRLWIMVAETDMTGIWLAPKRRRYLAFLAGSIVDAVSGSLLVGLLWADGRGWVGLSPPMRQLVGAGLFTYLLRLLWQCFLFVRTDLYYVVATALSCKNLMEDTEVHLRNALKRIRHSGGIVDQSAIPAREMRVVRSYSVVWLAGRALALASLVFVTAPVLSRYGAETIRFLIGGHSQYGVVDILTIAVVALGLQGAGLVAWTRGLYRAHLERRPHGLATE